MSSEVVSSSSSVKEEDIIKTTSIQPDNIDSSTSTNNSNIAVTVPSTPNNSKDSNNSGVVVEVSQQQQQGQQQQGHIKFIRRSLQNKNSDHDPIIAPGFGTAKDVRRLAQQLSDGSDIQLTFDTIICMMKSRGQNAATRRSSRGQTSNTDDDTATTAANATGTGTTQPTGAWADFMNEEGAVDDNTTAAVASSSKKRDQSDSQDIDSAKVQDKKPKAATTTTTTTTTSTTVDVNVNNDDDSIDNHYGVLCQTGTLDSAIVGRKKGTMDNPPTYNLLQPTRILPIKIKIQSIHTSSNSCHSIAISTTNVVYGWGRNEYNQLSNTLPVDVPVPTILHDLPSSSSSSKYISAATGKSHTLFLDTNGSVYSIGFNKLGQCGIKTNTDHITTYKKCIFQHNNEVETDISIKQIACGEDFSMAVSTEGFLYSAGSGEFGQLGNGSTGEHIEKAGKLLYTNSYCFVRRTQYHHAPNEKLYTSGGSTKEKTEAVSDNESVRINSVACGKHHSVAIEDTTLALHYKRNSNDTDNDQRVPRVFSWGCGAYGCLGHGVQVDEYFPRVIGSLANVLKVITDKTATKKSVLSASAGASCSLLQLPNGHVYYWGKHRSIGEATMRPSLVDVLANNAHIARHCDAGMQSVVVSTANAVTVSWGQGQHGELGFGPTTKSSSKPNFVTSLDGCRVAGVACGYGHTLFIIRNDDDEDQIAVKKLDELNHNDCQPLIDNADGKPKATEAKASKK